MNSVLTYVFPLTSFLFLIQNIVKKDRSIFLRIILGLPAFAMFLIDLFVYLIFYFNCSEARVFFKELNCIGTIYPTIDFLIFTMGSIVMLILAFAGIKKKWEKGKYYTTGAVVVYLGLCARLFLLITSSQVIAHTAGAYNPVVLEIFSIIVVYGMISSVFYLLISLLGFFTK